MKLRRQHPEIAPVAVQMDLEYSLDSEFNTAGFDLPALLDASWQWAEAIREKLPTFEKA